MNFSVSNEEKKIDKLIKKKNITFLDTNKRLIGKDFENSKLIVVNYLKTSLIYKLIFIVIDI